MIETVITPNFGDIDGLRHVNNTMLPVWFEQARMPLYKVCNPEMSLDNWTLILAHIDVDFLSQLRLGADVTIRSWVTKIGNSSFTVRQEAIQEGRVGARGNTVVVYFDFAAGKSMPLPENYRRELARHLAADAPAEEKGHDDTSAAAGRAK